MSEFMGQAPNIIGFTNSGRAVFAIAGGDGTDDGAGDGGNTDASQADDSATPDDPAQDTGSGGRAPSARKVDEELRRARDDAAKYRTQLREAQAKLKEAEEAQKQKEDAEKSELQKALDKAAELEVKGKQAEGRVKALALKNSVLLASQKLGVVDPDAAYRLLDTDKVEYDGDEPSNIDDLLTALIEAKPYLKKADDEPKTPSKSPTSPTQPATKQGGKALTMEDVGRMTDDEINARWDEVKKVMATAPGR